MSISTVLRLAAASAMFAWLGASQAADLNSAAIHIKTPDQLAWRKSSGPNSPNEAVLFGDPSKPGWYGILVKWDPGKMSRPHLHPHDRYVTVISGTWWVGTGPKYDPASTKPVPAGSFVTHYAKQIHYDGAKDGEVVLEIVGMGPETATPAEAK
ncbi:MAG TPA: cupin domain-containing protein [Bryobacteraceae bacterium]|nr:cupin domain-containing protein [Bryobacteraceae bacterium]